MLSWCNRRVMKRYDWIDWRSHACRRCNETVYFSWIYFLWKCLHLVESLIFDITCIQFSPPVWMFICCFKLPLLLNLLPHSVHWNGLSPVCTLRWIFNFDSRMNDFSHSWQLWLLLRLFIFLLGDCFIVRWFLFFMQLDWQCFSFGSFLLNGFCGTTIDKSNKQ